MEKLFRIDISYVGTSFCGWQTQPNGMTIQEKIQTSITTLLKHPVRLTGASRTDSGVHAEHQVATFRSSAEIDQYKFLRSLNALCGNDIAIWSMSEVDDDFHPISSSTGKIYRYQIWNNSVMNPFYQDMAWFHPLPLDIEKLSSVFSAFVGRHDFTSFCASDGTSKTFERTIISIDLKRTSDLIEIHIHGEGFLKQMVRNMVGTAVDIVGDKLALKSVSDIIAAKDRRCAGFTAPPGGLFLQKVLYD